MDTYGNSLRICGGCSAWLLTTDATTPTIYCGKCRAKRTPFDEWADALKPGDQVYVQPYAAWRGLSRSRYLIVDRDGDVLTVQVLGIPESRKTVNVCDCAQDDVTPWRHPTAMY